MKIRLLLPIVGLAISFALPTFAQEQNTVDPEVRQQIEAVSMKFVEAYNKYDAAALAALFTEDAVEVRNWPNDEHGGTASGREAIEKSSQPISHSIRARWSPRLFRSMRSATTYAR